MSNPIDALHGQKLVYLRFKHGNTKQDVVAKALGIKQQEMSNYELGKKSFSEDFIQQVCKYYKIDTKEFYAPNNGVMVSNNSNAGSNYCFNDSELVIALNNAYQLTIAAKDETIRLQNELLNAYRKNGQGLS